MKKESMNNRRKIACATLILVLTLVLLLHGQNAYALELDGKEKTLTFLSDVAMLDLSKYTITLRDYEVTYPSEYGGVSREDVRYILTTSNSKLDATIVFLNGTYSWCLLSWISGSPVYAEPQPANLIDSTKNIIARYQAYIGSSRFKEMQVMLNSVNKAENTVVIQGNMKLEVTVEFRSTSLQWVFNGVETSLLTMTFLDGALRGLRDHLSTFKIGDAEAKVTSEEAIDIAVNRANSFSWTVDGVPVTGFSVLREHSTALLTMNVRAEPLVLYPLWRVDLPLDKTYAGGVSAIAVGIWADTGEVSYIQELSYGGGPPPSNEDGSPPSTTTPSETPSTPDSTNPPDSTTPPTQTPSEPSTPNETETPTDTFPTTILIATATTVIVATTATALYLKKKKRKTAH